MSRVVVGFTFSNVCAVFQLRVPTHGVTYLIQNLHRPNAQVCVCVSMRTRLQICNQNCDKSAATDFLVADNRLQDTSFNKYKVLMSSQLRPDASLQSVTVLTLSFFFLNISAHSSVDWKQKRSKDSVFIMLGEEDSAWTGQTIALLTKSRKVQLE
jgi:hypothetical protein